MGNREMEGKEVTGTLLKKTTRKGKRIRDAFHVVLQVANMWLQWGKTTDGMPTEATADIDQWTVKTSKKGKGTLQKKMTKREEDKRKGHSMFPCKLQTCGYSGEKATD